ncbi:MAG TPA: hypothetical protein VG650_02100 [Mycobacteriales bacterium]|nr:hypothetical protein [Mycobacteriales bacterium]
MTAHRRIALLAAAGLAGVLAVGTAAAGTGSGTTRTAVVHDDTEAWYQVLPVSICSTPIGCPPPLPLPVPGPSTVYPAGTLHVGAALGVEISRTYLRPALYSLPPDAVLTGGTATIPIDSDIKAGTINAGSANLTACLVTEPVTDGVEGSLEDPPTVNCKVTSKVVPTAKGDAFTIDLAPFITAWRGGKPNFGFALLPVLGSLGSVGAWQVALDGQTLSGAPHITYQLTYSEPTPETTAPPAAPPVVSAPPAPVTVVPPVIPPAVTTTQPPVPAPVLAAPQPAAVTSGFKYSAVFLVPLAFLLGLLFLGRTFTRDATPLGATSASMRRH